MYAISSSWMLERNMLVVKLIGSADISKSQFINEQIKRQMISKAVNAISEAEKYNGKVLDVVPSFPTKDKTLVVCCSIIFTSEENLIEFQKACPQILYQG